MPNFIRQINVFLKVVEAGSFRGAARGLNLSPPAVSQHIAKLEEALADTLIYRSTRSLRITPLGERFYAKFQPLIAEFEASLQEFSQQAGQISLALPAFLAHFGPIQKAIGAFRANFPDAQLTLDYSDKRFDLIADGFDMALRVGLVKPRGRNFRHLFTLSRRAVTNAAAAPKFAQANAPHEVAPQHWVSLGPASSDALTFSKSDGTHSTLELSGAAVVNDAFARYQYSKQNPSIAIVPAFMCEEDLKNGTVINLFPGWELAPLIAYMQWRPEVAAGSLTMKLANLLAEVKF